MTRESLQNMLVLHSNSDIIILDWATGLGKSLTAIKVQANMKPQHTKLIVAETAHIGNWKEEYLKHGYEDLLNNTEILCYASLKNHIGSESDLIIFDEWHHLITAIRVGILSTIKAKKIVCLSATSSKEDVDILTEVSKESGLESLFKHTVTLKQAIQWGILPEPMIHLIPCKVDNYERDSVIEITRDKKESDYTHCYYENRWDYLKNKSEFPNIKIICTQKQKLEHLNSNLAYLKKQYERFGDDISYKKILNAGIVRKRFLGEIKTPYVEDLVLKIPNDYRFVCFCASVRQAQRLSEGVSFIHSGMSKRAIDETILAFQDGETNRLFCVGMLTEGQNIKNIQGCIIAQLDSEDRQFIQKSGRAMRGDEPKQFVFYHENTQDEEYLTNILLGLDSKYVNYIYNLKQFEI